MWCVASNVVRRNMLADRATSRASLGAVRHQMRPYHDTAGPSWGTGFATAKMVASPRSIRTITIRAGTVVYDNKTIHLSIGIYAFPFLAMKR